MDNNTNSVATKKANNYLAIGIMFLLFAMISFVTGLQNPMAVIVKSQFGASNLMSQLGNFMNFFAYLFLGFPAGLILKKYGYKITSLAAVVVGFIGVGITWLSGVAGAYWVYLVGAFVSGFSMCMLNTVANPMLNTLGGGGNKGNQLVQWGGSCNSLSATIVPILVGYLIADVSKANISDANPALYIAMGIFALAFIIIICSKIPEPELEARKAEGEVEEEGVGASIRGAFSYRNLVFGVIAIFLYVGIEVGIPNISNLYMTSADGFAKDLALSNVENVVEEVAIVDAEEPCLTDEVVCETDGEEIVCEETEAVEAETVLETAEEAVAEEVVEEAAAEELAEEEVVEEEVDVEEVVVEEVVEEEANGAIPTDIAGTVIGIYWLLMLIGRLIGASIGAKVSSRTMMIFVSSLAIILLLAGMFSPIVLVKFPAINSNLSFYMTDIPLGVVFFVLCGICTSIMWGSIFNLSVEGLGKYTSIASGLFMMMVVGGGILPLIQGWIADISSYINSYWVLIIALIYLLWFAIFGSKVVKKEKA